MKQFYSCDKCGKAFENYTDCYKHEDQHKEFSISSTNNYLLSQLNEYSQNSLVPEIIFMGYTDENAQPVLYKYKLVKQDSLATTKYIKLNADEMARREEEAKVRAEDLVTMLEELDNASIEVPEKERCSYYSVGSIYKKEFGHWFAREEK